MKMFALFLATLCLLSAIVAQRLDASLEQSAAASGTFEGLSLLRQVERSLTPKHGDWIVTGTEIRSNEIILLSGNLIIQNGGNLTLNNVTLIMNCSYDGQYNIEVRSGGAMYISDGSNITSVEGGRFMFWVRTESKFEMRDSELSRCGWHWEHGGFIIEANNTTIERSMFTDNYYGIQLKSAFNKIVDCKIVFNILGVPLLNPVGLFIWEGHHNTILRCNLSNNYVNLHLYYSHYNLIEDTLMLDGTGCGVFVLYNATHNSFLNCSASSVGGDAGMILGTCEYNTFKNCSFGPSMIDGLKATASIEGRIGSVKNNLFEKCNFFSNSRYGIEGYDFNNNIIRECTFEKNYVNIHLHVVGTHCNYNLIYHNNFFNGALVIKDPYNNYWYNATLKEGNYWSDYTGIDANGDGIGDNPYYIPGGTNKDNYPLMFPYPIRRNMAITEYPKFENSAAGIKISCNITNTETMDLTNVTVNFSVNQDLISLQKIDLPKNSSKTVTSIWQPAPGSYFVKVEADPEKAIAEINEFDNEKEILVRIYDFAALSLEKYDSPAGGYALNATIHCAGPSSEWVNVSMYVNNILYSSLLSKLIPESNTTTTFLWNPPTGSYSVNVKVNPTFIYLESNINNNEISTTYDIQRIYPDLAISSADVYLSQDPPPAQVEVDIIVNVRNIGYTKSKDATVKFFFNDSPFANVSLSSIAPGNLRPVTTKWLAKEGKITVELDTLGNPDGNILNNKAELWVDHTLKPDLSINTANISFTPYPPEDMQPVAIYATVFNLGDISSDTAQAEFYCGTALIGTTNVSEIMPSRSTAVWIIWDKAVENQLIVVKIIPSGYDKNSANNIASKILAATKKSDLTINSENITFEPQIPYEYSAVIIRAKIYNIGDATGEALVYFYESGTLIGNTSAGLIAPGQYVSVSITWVHAKRNETIRVVITPIRTDRDSNNNEARKTLTETIVPIKADLAISNIWFDPAIPIYNETCRICVNISNVGNVTSSSAILEFYDGLALIGNVTVHPLVPESSKIYSIDWIPRKGAMISAVITGIEDSNIADNADSVYVSHVARADIAVEAIRFSNENPAKGETIYIYADLRNTGDAPSRAAKIKFYANNIMIEQKEVPVVQPNQTSSVYVLWNVTEAGVIAIKAFVEYEDFSSANNVEDILLESKYAAPLQPQITTEQAVTFSSIIITALVGLSLYFKRYAVFSLFIPLQYKYLTKEKVISKPLRRQILAILEKNPGCNAYSLVKMTNKHYNAIDYNLKLLREFQLVKVIDTGYDKKYYLETQYTGQETTPEIERKIIDTVFLNPRISPTEVARKINPDADENFIQMIRRKLRELEIRGIFTAQYEGDIPKYSFAYPRSLAK